MTTEPDPPFCSDAGNSRPQVKTDSMGYQVPAAPPKRRQADMTDEEVEVAFAALWKKLEGCE